MQFKLFWYCILAIYVITIYVFLVGMKYCRSYHFTSHILLVPTKNKKIKRMKANFEQSANSSTTRLHERLYGTGSLSERKNYGLLKMKAQKRHKSIKRKHCGDGGSFTLACSTTYKVIEELLSIPIRF